MEHDRTRRLHHVAKNSAETARTDASEQPRKAEKINEIASGLIDTVTTRATTTPDIVQFTQSPQSIEIWKAILEDLEGEGLDAWLYCTKTGRAISSISPENWQDYLNKIASLGDCDQAHRLTASITRAIIAQKAGAMLPPMLTTSRENLSFIRETSPADYITIACGHIFPLSDKANSITRAKRGQELHAARASIANLDTATQTFIAETITLYLSHVKPWILYKSKQSSQAAILDIYQNDIRAPWQSSTTAAHFCGRLLQILARLIQTKGGKPLAFITPGDLHTLKRDYKGEPAYSAQRWTREQLQRQQAKYKLETNKALAKKLGLSLARFEGRSTKHKSSLADSLLDAFDLSAAMSAFGRETVVRPYSQEQFSQAKQRTIERKRVAEELLGLVEDEQETNTIGPVSLAEFMASPDAMAIFTTPGEDDEGTSSAFQDLDIFADESGLDDWDDWESSATMASDDLASNFDADIGDLLQTAIGNALEEAKPRKPRKRKAALSLVSGAKQAQDATVEALAASLHGLENNLAPEPSPTPTPTPTPKRRRVIQQVPETTTASTPTPTPATTTPTPTPTRRRVVKP